jgi:hypothetical protein
MITGEYMPFEPYVPPASPTRPAVPGERDADEADVREMVFRQEFLGLKGDEVIFLSYGMADGQWIEPPEAFLRRFDDLKLPIKSPREAEFPRRGEIHDGGRLTPIRDRTSGKRGAVYWVTMTWRSTDEAAIEVGRVGGPLDGGGHDGVVRRFGKGWVLDRSNGGSGRAWRS